MSNYTPSTNFAAKDALASGNPAKIIKGTEISAEFTAIQTAVATKYDSSSTIPVANGGTGATTLTGLVKGNGTGAFTAAVAGTDYLEPAAIGVTVQGYDVDTVKKDVANTFTATQTPDNGTASVSTTSTYTFDGADQIREITMTNAITVTFGAPTGITQYAMYKFILKAGDTSARTYAWNSAYKFPAATSPLTSGTTTNGAFDVITFIGGASNTLIYDGYVADVR